MEMCYDGALVMPSNCAMMSENEMMYTEGGSVSLPMKKSYLNKNTCKSVANQYTKKTGLGQMRIAKEIYAHAFLYYASPAAFSSYIVLMSANPLGISLGVSVGVPALIYIRQHAKSVELGGDSTLRVNIYNAIWNCF